MRALKVSLEQVNENAKHSEVQLKEKIEGLEKIMIDKDNEIVEKRIRTLRLETDNKTVKDKLKDLEENNLGPSNDGAHSDAKKDLEKTREFLMRTQEECKNLERKRKVESEKHENEIKEINLQKKAIEDKYGRIVKERESFKEKEDTFHDICKALKELRDLKKGPGDVSKNDLNASGEHHKETINKDKSEPAIDITGEETQGGTSSNLYRCETCGYKSSIEKRLRQHKKSKHASEIIPCELCDYKGNPEEYNVHVKSKHNKNKESSIEHRKEPTGGVVKIPCDMCEFISTSTSSYIKHIESKYQTKKKEDFEDCCLSCDKCDFKTATEKELKTTWRLPTD